MCMLLCPFKAIDSVPRKFIVWNLEVGLWRLLLLDQLPVRLGKSCLAPEVLPLLVLGEAFPVGPCEPVELQQGGR